MKVSMRFDGGKALAATLRAMPKSQSRAAQVDALLEAAEPITVVARRMAPRRPPAPDMADSIMAMQTRRRLDVSDTETGVIIGPAKRHFYAFFLEWGTAKMSAHPFMRPAFDTQKERSLKILQRRLWENVTSWLHTRDVR